MLLAIATVDLTLAQPLSVSEAARQGQVIEQLEKALGAETTDEVRFSHILRAMKGEQDANLRRRILDIVPLIPGPHLDQFLTNMLTTEKDSGLRSQVAMKLGRAGSQKCLATLVQVAANDPTSQMLIGCSGSQSSARRAATFAIAELVERFPMLADDAVGKLRALTVVDDVNDNEELADARLQSLYQITRNNALLQPFFERLKSGHAKDRERGVVAFRFLKLKEAPMGIIMALKDINPGVRSWSALVLGEIGDPKTAAVLMTVADETKEDSSVRCNAVSSLGRMKIASAADLMEILLKDPNPSVQSNAAIALYRITGKKVTQFPEGFRAD